MAQITKVINGLASYTNDPVLPQLADILSGRNIYVIEGIYQDGSAIQYGSSYPLVKGEGNNIYITRANFDPNIASTFLPNASGDLTINSELMDTLLHEDTHLRLGPILGPDNDPEQWVHNWVNQYVDRIRQRIYDDSQPKKVCP
jgi:hypothetical protein